MLDPTNVSIETSLFGEALRYGVVGVMLVVFGLVIKYMHREWRLDLKTFNDERKTWTVEKETIYEEFRVREDRIRKECFEFVEKLARSSEKANESLVEMLQQFLDKIIK